MTDDTRRLKEHPWKISYGPRDDRLEDFYIPALSRSVAYDRSAGFFSSSALAIAAAGIAHLIRNGGRMRLLVGAQLSEADVEAIRAGYDLREAIGRAMVEQFEDPADHLARNRLKALAWMIAQGMLDIRVVLPTDARGTPLPAAPHEAYFHVKTGVFTDAGGDRVAFTGSVNESETAWRRNYEDLAIYTSWVTEAGDTRAHLRGVVDRFQRLWENAEEGWKAIPVPQAVLDRLLTYVPAEAHEKDPLEPPFRDEEKVLTTDQDERILAGFVRDAGRLAGSRRMGMAASVIKPWPHQVRVAEAVVSRFPAGSLLCDEVGLGKTIEAGLILRQLVLDGRVKRALILTPKSVSKQLQEELYEKFVLDVPIYDGRVFRRTGGREWPPRTSNPWDSEEIVIASSQLAKRRDRQDDILSAQPYDLVIADEAHHARRREFARLDEDRPNNLLRLLRAMRQGQRLRCLILMTATPLQVHPVEVYDLLQLVGLGGRWGAHPDLFLRFFTELRRTDPGEIDWDFVLGMVRDAQAMGASLGEAFVQVARKALGSVSWERVRRLTETGSAGVEVRHLDSKAVEMARQMVRRLTPLSILVQRSTRDLLRRYKERGIIRENVCRRAPRPVWIPFTPEEAGLYEQVETYTSEFYRRYEEKRRGLGFVMTIYRRRLTSSFFALERSLERRLAFLEGKTAAAGFDDDDLEQDDLEADTAEEMLAEPELGIEDEIEYVERFLAALRRLPADSKSARLLADLRDIFAERDTVLIFTQYTDTMDHLRDQLRGVYGSQVACYSGRGGEMWDGTIWKQAPKETIKKLFLEGEEIKILIGTEALSEGLNLQACGVLVNFDMPWNPMRVEQRIGRIDRIGQKHEVVWIRNYFYEQSVEAEVYRRLEDRIDWFETVVGALQPILTTVGRTIQEISMAGAADRARLTAERIREIEQQMEAVKASGLDLDEILDAEATAPPAAVNPVPPAALERLLVQGVRTRKLFAASPMQAGTYTLMLDRQPHAVTFDPAIFEEHPGTLKLLAPGEPLLKELLGRFPLPQANASAPGRIVRGQTRESTHGVQAAARAGELVLYAGGGESGEMRELDTLEGLSEALAAGSGVSIEAAHIEAARQMLVTRAADIEGRASSVVHQILVGEVLACEEQARRALRRGFYLDLAIRTRAEAGAPGRSGEAPAVGSLRPEAVRSFAAAQGFPYKGLLHLLGGAEVALSTSDRYLQECLGTTEKSLRGRLDPERRRAAEVLAALKNARDSLEAQRAAMPEPVVETRILA